MSTAKVFVGSLPPGCKPEELRHLFTSYGVVVECDIMNRCGFVHLETVEMAEAAIAALNGIEFKGQAIVVEPGRPKDRRGGGGGGGAVGGSGSDGGRAANRRPMQGGNFNRGGHTSGNSFRGGAGGGRGNNRTSNSNDSHFGPMRNEGSFRQQRNAPYSKQNQSTDAPPQQAFNKNKFNQSGGYNDFHNGSHGGHRGGGFGAAKNIGQDRRGFALPAVDHHHQQQQQQMSFGSANKQGRFGNGPLPSGNSADNGMFQRQRNNLGMNSGSTQPGRGGFSANRGGFAGRGGFNARRGGSGQNSSQSGNFNKHGPTNGHHHQQHNNAPNSYQSDFPPLGSQGGSVPGRNRFNGPPRAALNMGGGNRRF